MIKRLLILACLAVIGGGTLVLFSYDLVKLDWVSFMEIQPSYKPMEDPLPVAVHSVPVEGAAFVSGMGAPVNPVAVDDISLQRGAQLYNINCAICHGSGGMGDGVISTFLTVKPADLTSEPVQTLSDGALFLTVSNGVTGNMPALNENLSVRDRWDVVNFVRTLAASK